MRRRKGRAVTIFIVLYVCIMVESPRALQELLSIPPTDSMSTQSYMLPSGTPSLHIKLPRHTGSNILPNCALFNRLLFLARKTNKTAIRDIAANTSANYTRLLTDVVSLRNKIWLTLSVSTREKLLKSEFVSINLLCAGGYEFSVAFLAIVALGAVVSPMSKYIGTSHSSLTQSRRKISCA